MQKSSQIEHPISDLLKNRKSTRAFSDQLIDQSTISSLFEATRWAPSSTNEQPWYYVYATRDQPLWETIFSCLNEGNQTWAKEAPLLIVSMARKNFSRYVGVNHYALYDLGGANAMLSLQAVELGLQVRQMAGFNAQRAIETLGVPDTLALGVVIAVGYPGDPKSLPENLKLRESAPRERFLQQEFVRNSPFD